MGGTQCLCRKSAAYRVTVNMIAQASLFNSYYPVENGSPAGSNYLCLLGEWGAAEIKAARALSCGKKENFSIPTNYRALFLIILSARQIAVLSRFLIAF